MTRDINLDPVTRITAGAQGEPGQRTFYIQARQGDVLVSLLVEKQQVVELSRTIEALLARLAQTQPRSREIEPSPELELEEPLVAEFRVGPMALGYDATRDLVLLQCEEFVPEPEDDDPSPRETEDQPEAPGSTARFWATRDQMRALARHGASVAAAGRPQCPLCGAPLEAEGHFCPPLNGHRG